MNPGNLQEFIDRGIKVAVFIEYIPVTPGPRKGEDDGGGPVTSYSCAPQLPDGTAHWELRDDMSLILTPEERARFRSKILWYRENLPVYFVHSPGDEEYFGGCVSAARGFAHVTPAGDLTPCPVSNIATHNLAVHSMEEALMSPLFSRIREDEGLLENKGTPCALFAHPEEVNALAEEVGAYRTDMEGKGGVGRKGK